MAQARPENTAARIGGDDKRRYPRIPLRLAAACVSTDRGASRTCEIRNFCAGGLLLAFPAGSRHDALPGIGTRVEVSAALPAEAGSGAVRLAGRVVRAVAGCAGIELEAPDRSMLRALVRCAEQQRSRKRSARNDGEQDGRGPTPADARELLATCRTRVIDATKRLAGETIDALASEMANPGPETKISEFHARSEFLEQIRRERDALTAAFVAGVTQRLDGDGGHEAEPAAGDGGLTLLGNEELEEWLSVSEISHHVEAKLKGPLNILEHRLAHIAGRPAGGGDHPFGPHVFAEAFQEMVESLHPTRTTRHDGLQLFKLLLTGWLEKLCRDLNALLIEHGVLPDLERTVVSGGTGRRPDTNGPAPEKTGGSHPAARPDPVTEPAVAPAIRGGGHAAAEQDLYELVGGLRELQRQFGHRRAARGATTGDAVPAAPPTLDSEAILGALARLRDDAAPAGNLRERIVAAAGRDSRAAQIGEREGGIIDVADTLFSSLLRDGLVAGSVHDWLQRLEVPLVRFAMHDDSIFVDRDHSAREVVNRIAQLEIHPSAGAGSALQREVNRVVATITAEENPGPEVFAKALKKLDLLIRMQEDAYSENLREVLSRCEAEPAPDSADVDSADAVDTAWLKRIGRLQVGDWILFTADAEHPRRLRLAWISKHRDRYVFVNHLGIREAAFDRIALARSFAAGEAAVMDSADEPALDRAQYAMLQNLHRQLLHETTHDQLTGLMNRREFERRLRDALEKARCTDDRYCLFQVDLAQFNVINSTCGPDTGDRVLTEIAQLLARTAGDDALTARIGSDEFCILLGKVGPEEALAIAQALIDAVRDYRFIWHEERMTVSAGLGMVHVAGFDEVSDLLQAAESSCRAARAQGINQIHTYREDGADSPSQPDILRWLNRIDKALNEDTLELRCQRIMPAGADDMAARPHHSEVLLGITDDNGELVSPEQFILTAEHYQRMPAVDRWVVRTMFRFLVEHRDRLDRIGGFAINLSGRSISDESFKDFIREEIAQSGAPMEYVCFEITETAGITSLSDAADFILEIRKTGCRFSLDDFGSGLSSYVYLKNLPVDYLKIDGGFVRSMDENPADFAVVRSITEIGHFMGKKIIAESVENVAVLERLREIGVDFVQGYAIERPVRLREIL